MVKSSPRVALITGSSRGIGFEIARTLGREGYSVVLNCNQRVEELQRAHETLRKATEAEYFVADVSDYKQAGSLVDFAAKRWGRLDVLVNNAGIIRDKLFHQMEPSDWLEVIQVNLMGSIHCAHHAVPLMKAQKFGRIVNIASIVAEMGNIGQTNYAASKAGLIGFTRSLAKEVAKDNITVNAVLPGFIDTGMTQSIPDRVREKFVASIPLGRLGQASDVSGLVHYLASDQASYVTGQCFHVDGGLSH
jgi:3-oxoacyl-[acyl-carrier protein] reductase